MSTPPGTWGQLISSVVAARIYGTARRTTTFNAGPTMANMGCTFQRGMGTVARGSGETAGIGVDTAGYYLVTYTAYYQAQTSNTSEMTIEIAGGSTTETWVTSTIAGRLDTISAHGVVSFAAGSTIRLRVGGTPSAELFSARMTAQFLSG